MFTFYFSQTPVKAFFLGEYSRKRSDLCQGMLVMTLGRSGEEYILFAFRMVCIVPAIEDIRTSGFGSLSLNASGKLCRMPRALPSEGFLLCFLCIVRKSSVIRELRKSFYEILLNCFFYVL